MKFTRKKPSLLLLVSLGLVALLPVLAVLQYLWMGKVSEAERARMQTSLRDGANKFTGDFDREIARLFLNFQTADVDKQAESFSACYANWRQQTAYPGLVSGIYFLDADEKNQPDLRRLNLTTHQLEPAQWPESFSELKRKFEAECRKQAEKTDLTLPPVKSSGSKPEVLRIYKGEIDSIAEEIPALVIHRIPARIDSHIMVLPFQARAYTIVALDLDYIRQEVIPQFAARYFSGSNGLDYNLTILNAGNPRQIVYQSDSAALSQDSTNDATADFLNLRFSELNTVVRENIDEIKSGAGGLRNSNRVAVQVFRSGNHGEADRIIGGGPVLAGESGKWLLLLKHHAGSLDAVVAGARHKNLAISFGILILLAASIIMILVSTSRAKNLARQQMEFVAGVSHELRTPLAVIRSAGENLADGVIAEKQQIQRYGKLIATEGRRLTDMVEQILEFSGIQSGRKNYNLRPALVVNIIENAITSCRAMIEEGGFEIHRDIQEDLPPVAADEAALSRTIQNLLTNAMKYSGGSRRIDIQARSRKTAGGTVAQITVADNGLGISEEDLPHIFEPFYRGREATEAQIHGSGLGLSLVKQIIEAHDGNITVKSETGKGSAFTLSLASKSGESGESSKSSESGSELWRVSERVD